ncbi:MAG: DNA translocase FtsK [Clostridia bacterium]|nr:DNA translocase FtsK [Clostridia bacterium]
MDNSRRDGETKKDSTIFTKETFGMLTVLFSALCFICLLTKDAIFSTLGAFVNQFLFGLMGYYAYLQCVLCAVFGVMMVMGKSVSLPKKITMHAVILGVCVFFLLHAITSASFSLETFGGYISTCYKSASAGVSGATGGGIISALAVYWGLKLFTPVGLYVILSLALLFDGYFIYQGVKSGAFKENRGKVDFISEKEEKIADEVVGEAIESTIVQAPIVPELHTHIDFSEPTFKNNLYITNGEQFAFRTKKDANSDLKLNVAGKGLNVAYIDDKEEKPVRKDSDMRSKVDYVKTPNALDALNALRRVRGETDEDAVSKEIKKENKPSKKEVAVENSPLKRTITTDYFSSDYLSSNDESVVSTKNQEEERQALRDKVLGGEYTFKSPILDSVNDKNEEKPFEPEVENTPTYDAPTYDVPKMDDDFDNFVSEVVEDEVVEPTFEDVEEPIVNEPIVQDDDEISDPFVDGDEDLDETVSGTFIEEIETVEKTPTFTKPTTFTSPIVSKPSYTTVDIVGDYDDAIKGPKNGRGPDKEQRKSRVTSFVNEQTYTPIKKEEPVVEEKPIQVVEPINRPYFTPGFNLFVDHARGVKKSEEDHAGRIKKIEDKLAGFKLPVHGEGYVQGPSITRYEFAMPEGASVKRVVPFDADLMATLEVKDGVRILAPIPGKNLVGVEVANSVRVPVSLKEVLEATAMREHKKGSLMFIIGRDVVGEPIEDDLTKGPHYLVAGSTGSGKSVFLNSLLISLIMRYSPEDLKLILIDPKLVEFAPYEHLPHLITDEILSDTRKILAMLDWAIGEMNRRNQLFRDCPGAVKDINDYNKVVANDKIQRLPRIVIVIDELADLMLSCKRDLEAKIQNIAQKARSAGIHLVLATQRPSTDVITGTIKTNLPSRVAFRVTNYADSSTILAESGAEKLLGRGDMLYKNSEMSGLERYQGTFISPKEIDDVVQYIIKNNTAYFNEEVAQMLENVVKPQEVSRPMPTFGGGISEDDPLFIQALRHVIESDMASTSMLQRRFQLGHARAGGIIDKMESLGYISGNEGCKSRRVLITIEEFEEKYGGLV